MSDTDWDVVGMDEPNLHQETGPAGKAFVPAAPQAAGASLDGPVPQYAHFTERQGMSRSKPADPGKYLKAKPQNTPMTHEQLMAKANQLLQAQRQRAAEAMAAGPAVQPDQDANGMALPFWLTRAGQGG